MKTLSSIMILAALGLFILSGCSKQDGPVGKKEIKGTVTYHNEAAGTDDPAPGALVHVAYGTTSSTTTYDQTVAADAAGAYIISGLGKGDYFITAEFTDSHGFTYTTPGYGVVIENKKDELVIDITLN